MEGSGERAGRPAPPRGLDPRTVAACFPETGGGSGRRRGVGARREGSHSSSGSLAPTPLPLREPGRSAGRPGWWRGGGGAQTKGACAFKAGSPGAGGEGTSGSGVEGGCAGQQGRGRGPGARRTAGGTAGTHGRGAGPRGCRPAGARGDGGAGAPGTRRPRPAGETARRSVRGGGGARRSGLGAAAGGLPRSPRRGLWSRRSGELRAVGTGGGKSGRGWMGHGGLRPGAAASHPHPSLGASLSPPGVSSRLAGKMGRGMYSGEGLP